MQDMSPCEIDQLLNDALIGRLSMADAAGRPYTIPLPFCWHDGTIYLRLPLRGRKGDVLNQNDQVCFEIDRFSETLDEYESVLIEGRLIAVESIEEKTRVKQLNDEKYNRLRRGYRPGHGRSSSLATLPMRKLAVTSCSGRKKESSFAGATALTMAQTA